MKERPILFSGEMIRALIAGTKTQTRRNIKPQPDVTEERLREMDAWIDGFTLSQQVDAAWQHGFIDAKCPYGQPGDRLWVQADFHLLLEITGVRVERLQDISESDVIAEGCPSEILYGRGWYRDLWEQLYGSGSWDANPWTWVIEFKRVEA